VISWLAARHWSLQTAAAAVFGVLTATGFAPFSWWPLAIIGSAGLTVVVLATTKWRFVLLHGYAFGLGLLGVGVGWMQVIFIQAMVALVAILAVYYLGLAALLRWSVQAPWWPLTAAAAWTITEFCFSRFPFGGFGWLRLGYTTVDSPLSWGLPVYGVAGAGFLAALLGQLLAWLLAEPTRRRGILTVAGLAASLGLSSLGLLVSAGPNLGEVNVGWVQGGAPGGGVYGLGAPRTLTRNHVAESAKLAAQIDAGSLPRPDFVVWPENSTDLDPYRDAETGALVRQAVARFDRPVLVGTILDGPGLNERQTASLWWDPVAGETTRYIKRGIVPFGEWVPLRDLLEPLIPELRYVGAQSVAGTVPGVITPSLPDGRTLPLGVLVCYDLAFDNIVADTVTSGGQVLVVQSSNAMYQGTGQIDQQFAITRARAMELRREVLVVTTSGVSGLIEPDGSVRFQTSDHTAASGVVTLPQRQNLTFAAGYGWLVELAVVIAGLVGLAAGRFYGRMRRHTNESGAPHG
jgi:apolipoprotein N-acyltransferase